VLQINGLPVSVTIATDTAGNATVPTVQVGNLSSYASVENCGIANFCGPIVDGMLGNMAGNVQSTLGQQLAGALNGTITTAAGTVNTSPFWNDLMTALANAGELTDGSYTLPVPGTSSAAGTAGTWVFDSMDLITGSSVTANLTSNGLCYVTCTPKTAAQACAGVACGTADDGCGDTIQCPSTCQSYQYCDGNFCETIPLCSPACPYGYICDSNNGSAPGVCVVNHRCPAGQHFCNNSCVPGTGACL
jgi:hypothetical protein